jgi:predicted transcriptional regulator
MDELVTHAEVMQWLPSDVQQKLTLAMTPEQRGWWTAEEAAADGGRFVEIRRWGDVEGRFLRG